jgi:hypothetical protein
MIRESVSSDEVINSVEEVERLVDRVSKLEAIINANKGLFKTPAKKTGWVNIYGQGKERWLGNIHPSKEIAEGFSGGGVIAYVEWEEKE